MLIILIVENISTMVIQVELPYIDKE